MINLGASPPANINPGPSPGPSAFSGIGMSNIGGGGVGSGMNGTPVGTPGAYGHVMEGMGMGYGEGRAMY